jgi:hypothetical protein
MVFFIHSFYTNMFRPAIAAIFMVILLLQKHKGTNIVSCVAVTP